MYLRVMGAAVLIATIALGAGCTGFTQMQTTVAKFDQATHTANTAQLAFLAVYRTSECRSTNVDRIFASIEKHNADLTLSVQCSYVAVSDADLKIRAMLLATLTLYADKLQEITSGNDAGMLNSHSEAVAKSINGFAKSSGLSQLQISAGTDANLAKGVETAVIELTGFVLEHKKFKTIQDAANNAQSHLETTIERLKEENTLVGQALQNNLNGIAGTIKLALAKEKQEKSPSLFFDIIQAQDLLAGYDELLRGTISANAAVNDAAAPAINPAKAGAQTTDPAAASSAKQASGDPGPACGPWESKSRDAPDPHGKAVAKDQPTQGTPSETPGAKPVNDILDAIVAGNRALAQSKPAEFAEVAQWIESCGKSLSTVYDSLGK